MKTKYILHGGGAQTQNAQNDAFFREILKDTKDSVRILLVHFASEKDQSVVNTERDMAQFKRVKDHKKLVFEIAEEDSFPEQIKKSDVVYFGGGTTSKLIKCVKKFSNLKDLFSGKTIAGESAGANVLAEYCYSQSSGGIVRGLGLVPVKTFCHYKGEDDTELENIRKDVETLLLVNYQFRVFEIS